MDLFGRLRRTDGRGLGRIVRGGAPALDGGARAGPHERPLVDGAESNSSRHYDVWNGRNVGSDIALTLFTLAVMITVLALLRPIVPRYAAGSDLSRFAWIAASLISGSD